MKTHVKQQVGLLLLLVSLFCVNACGQSGDLYLPEEETEEKNK